MKISIAWIFDHIDHDWRKIDVERLVDTFNKTTAEIEHLEKVSFSLDTISLVEVKAILDVICVQSAEWRNEFTLPFRDDAKQGDLFLVKREGSSYRWLSLADLSCNKEGLLHKVSCDDALQTGGWKRLVEGDDYILTLDNKSITHRPDLWGHRGLAREVAAMLKLPFKPIKDFVQDIPVEQAITQAVVPTETNSFTIENKAPDVCRRFGGAYIADVKNQPSSLPMAFRLARVDSRPIDALVDITNYVMLELSQPMHAFDADTFATQKLVPRMAKKKEKLVLLDEQEIELTPEDIVITDGKTPVSLAGVMGGLHSGISATTKNVILESAIFDATTIRRTSARHHVRTEASARFEKTLDPNQNTMAVQRFIRLMNDAGIAGNPSSTIFSLGAPAQENKIQIAHAFIEGRLGVSLERDFVVTTLERLGFTVQEGENGLYTILVPTFRGTKDVTLKEDIVEEIGRYYGYDNIVPELPRLQSHASPMPWLYRRTAIKEFMAFSMQMREVATYGMFDEEFLREINWEPTNTVAIQNPVSENLRRMATTLVPNLLKVVVTNNAEHESLRFFELGRTWNYTKDVVEKKVLTGVLFEQKKTINFYDAKELLSRFFARLGMAVEWVKVDEPSKPWFKPYQTAQVLLDGAKIGIVGKAHPAFMANVCEGDAFIFEFDADVLLHYTKPLDTYKPLPKYPTVERDVSMLIPATITAEKVEQTIASVDKKISDVTLVDFFEKEDWLDKRSLTFRFVLCDERKTMTKQEVDAIADNVAKALTKLGATIR